MQVTICAVGRLRQSPELHLIENYLDRFAKIGRALSLGPAKIIEIEAKKGGGQKAEAELLARSLPKNALICTLDERGKTVTSPQFAGLLENWRDQGRHQLALIIGGADGIGPDLLNRADASISFGKMVWPHMLARVMLAEQLYRAASILAGSPYHRA